MPKILDSAVKQIKAKGYSKSGAYAIATSTLQKAGELDSHAKLTLKGKKRDAMGHAGRVRERAPKGKKT